MAHSHDYGCNLSSLVIEWHNLNLIAGAFDLFLFLLQWVYGLLFLYWSNDQLITTAQIPS